MVVSNNHLGSISISKQFFTTLIGGTATGCFGVVGMNSGSPWQNAVEFLPLLRSKKQPYADKGVTVKAIDGMIHIDLHITVSYGVNVSSVVKSIQHKVTYVVEEQTGMKVGRVNVFIDAIKS
ncbi:MAG: Asp23/Gls24 family envelope stress response protein [Oscillospiraceae bacterium]|nr:Asp23/Gls24 family envelope stress response protein [Oscillospiraceae bacterium]